MDKRLCHNARRRSTDGKVEKSLAYRVPMQLSLGMDPTISVSDIAGRNKRICREEDTDNMRLEASGNTGADDNARSYPHGGDNTAEAGNSGADGDTEGENGNSRFPTTEESADKTVLG